MSSGNPFTKKEIRESSLRQPTVAYSAAPAHPGMSGRTITVRMSHTKKQLHGWWPGRRECTSERLLINPYVGCAVDCLFCYTKSYPGAFFDFRRRGIITVWPDFDQTVARQLDSLSVAACGYLSPVTDPFQEVNRRYRLSEKIIAAFIERNIPLEFITKEVIPQKAIDLVARHPHSFGQVTILTLDEGARRSLMSGGATTDDLLRNLERLSQNGVFAVCRIDPIIPGVNDDLDELEGLIHIAMECGARHIVSSVLDIPVRIGNEIFSLLSRIGSFSERQLRDLYGERIGMYRHAAIDYRRTLFERLRQICDDRGVTLGLCMEFEKDGNRIVGLNRDYMSSVNCEGIDVPIYRRRGEGFVPAADCSGACLTCGEPECGIEELAMARPGNDRRGFTLSDYRKWGRRLRPASHATGDRTSLEG
ncbi:hypothetical protein AMJ39_03905 [candidate division TA06 bacterium DG_24]|uniref:Radical SAM core domain-containing protein n=1 Tax=candidate division TA06 bacterium DG_24 TaxID=1703770 RepID=A0A0S7WUP9_UNCT6|nr:MAG: hypothetical protein AMJ39_03905 [candidate division TA06 bacterium DG_24]